MKTAALLALLATAPPEPLETSGNTLLTFTQDAEESARVRARTIELLPATIDGATKPIVFMGPDGEDVAWLDRNCDLYLDPRYAKGAAYAYMADAMGRVHGAYGGAETLKEISCLGADGFRVTWSWPDLARGHLVILSLVREPSIKDLKE